MDIREIIKHLLAGDKISPKHPYFRTSVDYLYLDNSDNNIYVLYAGTDEVRYECSIDYIFRLESIFEFDRTVYWELYTEPVETFDFLTAFKYLRQFKKVNRMVYSEVSLFMDITDDILRVNFPGATQIHNLSFEDYEATDWYLIKD